MDRHVQGIETLFNFDLPQRMTIRAASLQFVRKLSGFTAPSKANERATLRSRTCFRSRRLVMELRTNAQPSQSRR